MTLISEMTNAELDEHIAKLRGWKQDEDNPIEAWKIFWIPPDKDGKVSEYLVDCPSPTTDPRYAMELLEEIVKDGIHSYTLYCDGGAYYSFEIRVAGGKSTAFAEGNDKLRVINEAYAQWKGAE